jgi:hypothetical protein
MTRPLVQPLNYVPSKRNCSDQAASGGLLTRMLTTGLDDGGRAGPSAQFRLIVSGNAAALVVAFEGSDGLAPEPPAGRLAWL